MVANVGYEFHDQNSIPIVCRITDEGLLSLILIQVLQVS